MLELFNTPSIRRIREENRKKAEYAESHIAPEQKILMNKARDLFRARAVDIPANATAEEINGVFNECIRQVPGAEGAFETWGKLFEGAYLN